MKFLIVATSKKSPNLLQEIGEGIRPRLDYIELADRMQATWLDYDNKAQGENRFIREIEERAKVDLFWGMRLARKIRAEKYDVVLSMSERIGISLGLFLGKSVEHYVILHHMMSPEKLKLLRLSGAYRQWKLMLPLSKAEAKALKDSLAVDTQKVYPFFSPVDTRFYYPVCREKGSGDYILSVGVTNRDYSTLIQAMSDLPDIPCQISGTSAWVQQDQSFDAGQLPPNVVSKDYNHPTTIRTAYMGCRFVVVPIQKDTSQWSAGSTSVLQPQSMGIPVVATRAPGLQDYVDDGKTGILVEPGNIGAMREAIQYLWTHPDEACTMGENGKRWVQDNFSTEAWVDKLHTIITGP
ncbi:MAG: glycosyltransferase family 4 protein [Chloroflexi bacterium]|jgi:glycosyltransferase involved in cell wall biosynthesis|nr:glycosyltransferase family 4 protein [Chloroflexota bacterium]